ncbi:MAG: hypothetical protein GY715_21395 [Planctomycetes bacterium]|nr:hypothetical protein [Planctomycetota bacterium]
MLWDDQVALADTLREKRKVISTLLVLLIGLGIFKLQFHRPPGHELVVSDRTLVVLTSLLIPATLCFLLGAYFLFTERPLIRRFSHWLRHFVRRNAVALFRKARADTPQEYDAIHPEDPPPSPWPSGRAVSATLDDDEAVEDLFHFDYRELIEVRSLRLRAAYQDLRRKNKRVSDRLKSATAALLIGYVFVFGAICVYLVALGQ